MNTFLLERPYISYGIANGLMGSIGLWAFWTPFITFLALPIASAMLRTQMCSNIINYLPSQLFPSYVGNRGDTMLKDDDEKISELNTGPIVLLWMTAGLVIVVCLWSLNSLVSSAMLDPDYLLVLGLILTSIVIVIELVFFVFVGTKANIVNIRNVLYDTFGYLNKDVSQYTN